MGLALSKLEFSVLLLFLPFLQKKNTELLLRRNTTDSSSRPNCVGAPQQQVVRQGHGSKQASVRLFCTPLWPRVYYWAVYVVVRHKLHVVFYCTL